MKHYALAIAALPSLAYAASIMGQRAGADPNVAVSSADFRAALIVVDYQNDFTTGSLKVPDAASIAGPVKELLSYPFTLKIATRDWHPQNHTSFASNHPGAAPFVNKTKIYHPTDSSRFYETLLWPDHCVQNTPGADLVPELNGIKFDYTVDKGQRSDVEMYSAFYDPFKVSDSGLLGILKDAKITDVYVVGLAADYCVNATAQHARENNFQTYIVDEGTRAVDPARWPENMEAITNMGVPVVSIRSDRVEKVKALDPNADSEGTINDGGGRVSSVGEKPTGPKPNDPNFQGSELPESN